MPLSDATIRRAKPGVTPKGWETTKSYKLGDSGGLYLEVASEASNSNHRLYRR